MKKRFRRLVSVLTVVMIISGSLSAVNFIKFYADTESILFSDDFNSYGNNPSGAANKNAMIANGWDTKNNTTGNYNTGSDFTVPAATAVNLTCSNKSGSDTWKDYSVSANIKINENTAGSSYAYISGMINSQKGYWLRLWAKDGVLRGLELQVFSGYSKQSVLGTYSLSTTERISPATKFRVKMEFAGGTIKCYLNDTCFITANDTTYTAGCAGIHTASSSVSSVTFDDFSVEKLSSAPEYEDDFSDDSTMTSKGWSSNVNGSKKDGRYVLDAAKSVYLSGIAGASSWKDYTFEADVALESGAIESSASARIVAHTVNAANSGYEYGITVDSQGNKSVILYKRGVSGGKINGKVLKYDKTDLMQNESYRLRMTLYGKRIICYLDGSLIFDVDDSESLSAGYIGLRSVGNSVGAAFDNIVVREVTKEDISYTYQEGYYYSDEFNKEVSMTSSGWSSDSGSRNTSAGIYEISPNTSMYLSGIADSDKWDNYVIEAKMALKDGNPTALSSARIVARSTNKASGGYEFGLTDDPEKGTTYLQLYKRGVSGGKINGTVYTADFDGDKFAYHEYKMIVLGDRIIGLIDGTPVFDVTDGEAYTVGYAGIKALGNNETSVGMVLDGFSVRNVSEEDLKIYDGFYPQEYYYKDDFDVFAPMTAIGWNTDAGKRVTKEKYFDMSPNKAMYLSEIEGAENLTDYVVEGKLCLNKGNYVSAVSARIVARSTEKAKNGYEFGMTFDPISNESYLLLYKRGESGGKINNTTYKMNIGISPEEYHTLRMVVTGNRVLCLFDGMKVFDVTDNGTSIKNVKIEPYLKGYAGIRAVASEENTVGIKVDSFCVKFFDYSDIIEDNEISKLSEDVWFFDNFDGESSLSERGWDTDLPGIYNGQLQVNGSAYMSNVKGSRLWSDYEVSADVTVDTEKGLIGESTIGSARICMRSSGPLSGYEYGIITPAGGSAYLILYDRTNKANIAVDKNTEIDEGVHSLRAVCSGDVIQCYFDGKLVFNEKSTVCGNGFAGVRASGYNTYYDNFKVSKLGSFYDFPTTNSPVSPITGYFTFGYKYLAPVVFVISGIALIIILAFGFVVSEKKDRKEQI